MKCLNCQMSNPDSAIYCQKCGTYLVSNHAKDYADTFKSLLLSLVLTSIFYRVFPLPFIHDDYLQQLFAGAVSEAIMGLSVWSLFIIWFKWSGYRKQVKAYQGFLDPQLLEIIAEGIYLKNYRQKVETIVDRLQKKGIRQFQNSILFRRVRRILQYTQAIPKKEEISKILSYQAEIDYNRMENGYTLLNVFIWAIPILGFIGTVYGIGNAVGAFSEFVRTVNTVAMGGQMRSALGGVTSGLSIAFNTTYLALLCVIPIMGLSSFLHKREEDLMLLMEEYCLEELLPHLHLHPGELPTETANEHLYQLMQFSEGWLAKMAPLLDAVASYAESLTHQITGLQPLVKDFSDNFFTVKDQFTQTGNPTAEPAHDHNQQAQQETATKLSQEP